jgi:hypothetical protein
VCPFIGGLGAISGVSYLRKTVIGRGLTLRAIINGRPSSRVIRARGVRQVQQPFKQDRRSAQLERAAASGEPDREAVAMKRIRRMLRRRHSVFFDALIAIASAIIIVTVLHMIAWAMGW